MHRHSPDGSPLQSGLRTGAVSRPRMAIERHKIQRSAPPRAAGVRKTGIGRSKTKATRRVLEAGMEVDSPFKAPAVYRRAFSSPVGRSQPPSPLALKKWLEQETVPTTPEMMIIQKPKQNSVVKRTPGIIIDMEQDLRQTPKQKLNSACRPSPFYKSELYKPSPERYIIIEECTVGSPSSPIPIGLQTPRRPAAANTPMAWTAASARKLFTAEKHTPMKIEAISPLVLPSSPCPNGSPKLLTVLAETSTPPRPIHKMQTRSAKKTESASGRLLFGPITKVEEKETFPIKKTRAERRYTIC